MPETSETRRRPTRRTFLKTSAAATLSAPWRLQPSSHRTAAHYAGACSTRLTNVPIGSMLTRTSSPR